MTSEIEELYAYNRWANHRILDAAERLTPDQLDRDLGSSFPSVRATLAHMLAAEWIWLTRFRGTSPSGLPSSWDLSSLALIRGRWTEVERDQEALLAGLTDANLSQPVDYRDTRGNAFSSPLWQLLRHVVNHATYHRGQVTTMLRQLGAEAVSTDLVVFYREGHVQEHQAAVQLRSARG